VHRWVACHAASFVLNLRLMKLFNLAAEVAYIRTMMITGLVLVIDLWAGRERLRGRPPMIKQTRRLTIQLRPKFKIE
jgi:hypothetical protein